MKRLLLAGLLLVATVPLFGQLHNVKNFAVGTVSTGYDAAATSITLTTGHGARFLSPATDGSFYVVWYNATDYPNVVDDPNKEIVLVTARSTDVLTVTRGQEGTSAATHNTAGKTYKMFQDFLAGNYRAVTDSIDSVLARRTLIEQGAGDAILYANAGATNLYRVAIGAGLTFSTGTLSASASSPTFAQILTGSNTSATMTVGTGGTLGYSGSGIIDATRFLGVTTVDATEFGYLNGVTSAIQTQFTGKQAADADLTSIAANATGGFITRTAADTYTARTITGTAGEITVANGDGVSGNPTLSVPDVYPVVELQAGMFYFNAGDLGAADTLNQDPDNTNDWTTEFMEFSATADQYVSASVNMPEDWDGTTAPKFKVVSYSSGSHATQTARLSMACGWIRPGTDSWVAALGTAAAVNQTYTTANVWQLSSVISPTPAGTAAAGAQLKIRLGRLGTDGTNDTFTSTTRFVKLLMKYKRTIYGSTTDW